MQNDLPSVHRKILKEAWQITWHNKWLWFLGLFAAFWSNSETYQYLFSSLQAIDKNSEVSKSFWQQILSATLSPVPNSPFSIIFFTLTIAVLGLIIWLVTASRGGLLAAVNGLKEGRTLKIRQALSDGTEKFWQIFSLSLLSKIICAGLLFGLIIFIGKYAFGFWAFSIPLYLLVFIVFLGLAIIISFVTIFALSFVMLRHEKFLPSISKAVTLFIKNWLLTIELALIIFGIGLLLGLILIAVGAVLSIPMIIFWAIMTFLGHALIFWFIGIPLIIVAFIFLLFFGAAFSVFQVTAWVLLFKRLTEEGAVSKLIRIFHGHKK